MASIGTNTNTTSASASTAATREADTKISNDLAVLREKMDLLETMLNPDDPSSPRLGVSTNDAVKSVVGYLDACGPRTIELVTVCSGGACVLSESVFGEVLGCNDRLRKLLSVVDARIATESAASTTAAGASSNASAMEANDLTGQFDDLLLGSTDNAGAQGTETTGDTSDDFDIKPAAKPTLRSASISTAPAATSTPTTDNTDPFDDFFAERTAL